MELISPLILPVKFVAVPVPKATHLLVSVLEEGKDEDCEIQQHETAAGPIYHRTALYSMVWIWLRWFPLFQ